MQNNDTNYRHCKLETLAISDENKSYETIVIYLDNFVKNMVMLNIGIFICTLFTQDEQQYI
jgi:hypothetical protein